MRLRLYVALGGELLVSPLSPPLALLGRYYTALEKRKCGKDLIGEGNFASAQTKREARVLATRALPLTCEGDRPLDRE